MNRDKWSWSKLRFIGTTPFAAKLQQDLLAILRPDPDVTVFTINGDAIWEA